MAELISVYAALEKISSTAQEPKTESMPLELAFGRTLAQDVKAQLTQPPFKASAMDGYAVRLEDAEDGRELKVIGEAPAGHSFEGKIEPGQALRIFTGGVIPKGADHIVIQEDVIAKGDMITINDTQTPPAHIRLAGIDFKVGEILFRNGTRLNAVHLSTIAAANISHVKVTKRPAIGIFANGDELIKVGTDVQQGQIISSTPYAISALVQSWGGEAKFYGIIPDNHSALESVIQKAETCDVIVPLGGASVGDYDLVKTAFKRAGYASIFEKIAIKPGKPTWLSTKSAKGHITRVLGLPGNPASGLVCAHLFLRPLIESLCASQRTEPLWVNAHLTQALRKNGPREIYHRAKLVFLPDGRLSVTPMPRQDSSLLSPFAKANAFIKQPPKDGPKQKGDIVEVYRLSQEF